MNNAILSRQRLVAEYAEFLAGFEDGRWRHRGLRGLLRQMAPGNSMRSGGAGPPDALRVSFQREPDIPEKF